MIEKTIFLVSEARVALAYDTEQHRAWIGGHLKDRAVMLELLCYFARYTPRMKKIQRYRIRFEFNMNQTHYDNVIKELEEKGFAFEKVKRFGRLTR